MEKIININLGGRVISIEDAAYTSLKAYFESLHRYFDGEEGRDEIINDIESRVAELMEEKLKRGAGAITEADVQEIIGSIGRVEDFAAEEDAPHSKAGSAQSTRNYNSRRFYRDENDKIVGGVCSGLASYLNVDPALVRIVFAILAFGGWGSGIFLYLLLWIFVPSRPMEGYRGKRLFRSEDDKWLGGVASGLGAYFDKEPWVFRLIFAAPFILSIVSNGGWWFFGHGSLIFGSFTGTFVLIYIVLWVVLPVARSQFEKMEMRGEKVDLNSIRQNVAANMGDIKSRVKDWSGEATQSARDFMNTRGREFGREVAYAARSTAHRGGSVIGSIIKAFFMFIGISIAFSLFVALISYSFGGFADVVNGFVLQTTELKVLGWFTVILLLGVPLVSLVTFMVRRSLKIRGRNYLSLGFVVLWIAGFVCAGILAPQIVHLYASHDQIVDEVPIAQPTGNRLILTVPGPEVQYSNSLPWMQGEIHGWDVAGDSMKFALVGIATKRSPDSLYHVYITRYSRGRNAEDARAHASQISYTARTTFGVDSVLQLDNRYLVTKAQGYRGQDVTVEVQVPVGKMIRFDESVDDKLSDVRSVRNHSRHTYDYHGWNASIDVDDDYVVLDWRANTDYVMSADGNLVDAAHPQDTVESYSYSVHRRYGPSGYRYGRHSQRHQTHRQWDADRQVDSLDRAMERLEAQKDALNDSDDEEDD